MQINVFGRTTKQIDKNVNPNEIRYGRGEQPSTTEGKKIFKEEKYAKILKMSDTELLNVLWGATFGLGSLDILGSSDLKKILETHYRNRTGKELSINMPDSYWTGTKSNSRGTLLKEIQKAVQRVLEIGRWSQFQNYSIDCSAILDKANINFSGNFENPSLLAPMGGVQEVDVRTLKVQKESYTSYFATTPVPTVPIFSIQKHKDYSITLEIRLRDRFAVDEDDFTFSDWKNYKAKTFATSIGQKALMAFWILQHQRGYPPFKWNAIFQSTIRVHQPVKK